MEHITVTKDGFVNITMSGHLTFSDYDLMRDLVEHITSKNFHNISIDLTNLEFIDSSGLGMILVLNEVAERNKIKFSVCGAHGDVLRSFELSILYQLKNEPTIQIKQVVAVNKATKGTLDDDIYKLEVEDAKMAMLIDLLVETMRRDKTIESLLMEFYSVRAVTSLHFKHEVAAMCKWGYGNIDKHVTAHNEMTVYIEGVIAFLEAAKVSDSTNTVLLSAFMVSWHSEHARDHDGAFVTFLKRLRSNGTH